MGDTFEWSPDGTLCCYSATDAGAGRCGTAQIIRRTWRTLQRQRGNSL